MCFIKKDIKGEVFVSLLKRYVYINKPFWLKHCFKCCAHVVWGVIIPCTRVPDVQHAEWTRTKTRGNHSESGFSAAQHS